MDAKQYEVILADAEARLKRLRALYDQWFSGIERIEPAQQRRELDALFGQLRREQPRNTGLRFRCQQLLQRYTTYTTYWRRIARQIEDGTYKRDVLRARRLAEMRASEPPPAARRDVHQLEDVDVDVDAALAALRSEPPPPAGPLSVPPPGPAQPGARPAVRRPSSAPPLSVPPISRFALPGAEPAARASEPARSFPVPAGLRPPPVPNIGQPRKPAPPPPTRAPVQGRPAAAAGGASAAAMADDQMRRIYERYVEARRRNSERTDVKYESVERTVRGMLPKLQQKHAGKNIDFEVVVKDGKVALKPVAR
jgi:hypothetical protein